MYDIKDYEKEVMKNFSKNLRYLMDLNMMNQRELAKRLGIAQQSVSKWLTLQSVPRMNMIEKICSLFKCSVEELTGNVDSKIKDDRQYYTRSKTEEMAQKIFENKDLRMLFDACQDVEPETLHALHQLLFSLKKKDDTSDESV